MNEDDFRKAFGTLAGTPGHFPWQWELYTRFIAGDIPLSCNLPTGLGKTSVIHVWLLALATNPKMLPRRLVYVVNRRTVVDQTTNEVENLRKRLPELSPIAETLWSLCATRPGKIDPEKDRPLAISTLRGQFADNREWSADPSRPAVICGTVDMIGSRLLFSGYGCGFKTRPLHAGFLGQDALIVHDEAHLEPAFQDLLTAIEAEQKRCKDFSPLRVMELTATSRAGDAAFGLTDDDKKNETVQKRLNATKNLHLIPNKDEKKLAEEIADLAVKYKDSGHAILVFVRKVDDVAKIVKKLPDKQTRQLTGTLRGYERDALVEDAIFKRFLPKAEEKNETVYLVCTSAGEVGVNISADHLICDLSTFESMAQRFGRVNRFGNRDDTEIHVIHPKDADFDDKDDLDIRRKRTLALIRELNGDGSPAALSKLQKAKREGADPEPMSTDRTAALRDYILEAFSPQPTILPTSDILFDAWALTSIRDKLPGRPTVEPYLHGITSWEPPETHVAWRKEVWELRPQFKSEEEQKQREPAERKRLAKFAEDLLEDYPLKPHELLRDRSDRVFKHLTAIATRHPATYAWLVDDEGSVEVFTLNELADKDKKDRIDGRTILLPEQAGGLRDGLLDGSATVTTDLDVADEWYTDDTKIVRRRCRLWDNDTPPPGMRRIRKIDIKPDADEADEESADKQVWYWYESAKTGDGDGSKAGATKDPISWDHHTSDVTRNTERIVSALGLTNELQKLLILAAKLHDLGKQREVWQRSIGNPKPKGPPWYAKSARDWKARELTDYRHEFGSLIDATFETEFTDLANDDLKAFVLHVIATHHGYGRPHFPNDRAFDLAPKGRDVEQVAREVPQRFARLQRKYGRWGLAYLESLLRAADYAASANPSEFMPEDAK